MLAPLCLRAETKRPTRCMTCLAKPFSTRLIVWLRMDVTAGDDRHASSALDRCRAMLSSSGSSMSRCEWRTHIGIQARSCRTVPTTKAGTAKEAARGCKVFLSHHSVNVSEFKLFTVSRQCADSNSHARSASTGSIPKYPQKCCARASQNTKHDAESHLRLQEKLGKHRSIVCGFVVCSWPRQKEAAAATHVMDMKHYYECLSSKTATRCCGWRRELKQVEATCQSRAQLSFEFSEGVARESCSLG